MDSARQQIVDSINANTNVLVTVSTNPSVDELSAALGLTILLNNLEKRATAVFSGRVPAAINFLEPDKTFEDTADSLRDFIIALDKEKADHLRYKVDGDVVKIFITPYRTTLSQKDLDFSQGDYNVELVIAIGVKDQDHLDKALAAHGKILHDASVVTITAGADASNLGSVDWHDPMASSLGEMMVSLADGLKTDKPLLDEQISTAFLTGIVSATDRFSNDRTSSRVMTMAAQLMAAGANQQLIAAKLAEAHDIGPGAVAGKQTAEPEQKAPEPKPQNTNELSIDRQSKKGKKAKKQDDAVPVGTPTDAPESTEVPGEKELEAQIAASSAPVASESMADIEQALKDATSELTEVSNEQPVAPVTDQPVPELQVAETAPEPATPVPEESPLPPLPDFPVEQVASQFAPAPPQPGLAPLPEPSPEASEPEAPAPSLEPAPAPVPEPVMEPELPPLPPLPDFGVPQQESSMIVNDHGSFSDQPPSTTQPINSINAGPVAGDASINPFAAPINASDSASAPAAQQETPFEPIPAPTVPLDQSAQFGTSEGAAQLAAMPPLEPVAAPAPVASEPEIPSLPPLPPLPPLPADGSLPPLPPPPPMPDFSQPLTPLSGAVSGDVFGDSAAPAAAPAPAPSTPSEPGQYRIPGQG